MIVSMFHFGGKIAPDISFPDVFEAVCEGTTTSKILKGDTHISDVKTSHVTNLRLVTALYHKRHQYHNTTIYLILEPIYW